MSQRKRLVKTGLILVILLAGLMGLHLSMDYENKTLSDALRDDLGVSYLSGANGSTAYEMQNETEQNTVVFVHGFSVPSYVWEPTFEYFSKAGYRVIRFDLFGRGFSDRPNTDYTLDLYVSQLNQLLDGLGIEVPVHLVGLSMGGPVSTRFSHQYPDKVKGLSLLAPLVETPERFDLELIKTPIIGDYLSTVVMMPKVLHGLERAVFDTAVFPDWYEKMYSHIHYRGYRQALLSSVRYLAGKSFVDDYRQLHKSGVNTQLIWGKQDQIVELAQSELILEVFPSAKLTKLDQCGHLPQKEKPEQVNRLLSQFFLEVDQNREK